MMPLCSPQRQCYHQQQAACTQHDSPGTAPACCCRQHLERRHLACRVIVLEDNDILHLARGAYNIYNLQRDDPSAKVASVSRALSRLDMEVGINLNTCCH